MQVAGCENRTAERIREIVTLDRQLFDMCYNHEL